MHWECIQLYRFKCNLCLHFKKNRSYGNMVCYINNQGWIWRGWWKKPQARPFSRTHHTVEEPPSPFSHFHAKHFKLPPRLYTKGALNQTFCGKYDISCRITSILHALIPTYLFSRTSKNLVGSFFVPSSNSKDWNSLVFLLFLCVISKSMASLDALQLAGCSFQDKKNGTRKPMLSSATRNLR